MRAYALLFTLFFLPICSFGQVPACFIGSWKSDEALTLEDMRKHPEVTEKARALFENKFFGRLTLHFGPHSIDSYFEGKPGQIDRYFQPIDVAASGPNWVTLRSHASGAETLQRWVCEKGRIYAVVTKWEFREYFSPLP